MSNESAEDAQSTRGTQSGLRYALVLVVLGVVVAVGVYQYVNTKKAPLPVASTELKIYPIPHTRVNDIPADTPTILIGLMSQDYQVLLDASVLCEQPHFRDRSEIAPTADASMVASFVASAPDIELPPRLRNTEWSIVSDSNGVVEIAATQAYQWLGQGYAPMGNNCLFVGSPMASFSPYGSFDIDKAVPVLALSAPAHVRNLRLIKQPAMDDIGAEMNEWLADRYPWLRDYLSSKLLRCEDYTVKPKQLKVVPIALQTDIDTERVFGWFVTNQCDGPTFHWVLVIAKPDAGFEMVAMEGTQGAALDFFPTEAWVVDANGDGLHEILIKATYYEGEAYKLLRFVTSSTGTHALRQMASSAYYGL